MRLIDADKLIDNLDDLIPVEEIMPSDRSVGIVDSIQEVGRMALEEEIEAIPIEWIKKYYTDITMPYTDTRIQFEEMIRKWGKENE